MASIPRKCIGGSHPCAVLSRDASQDSTSEKVVDEQGLQVRVAAKRQRLIEKHWSEIRYALSLAADYEESYAQSCEEAEPSWAKRSRKAARSFLRLRKKMASLTPKVE